MSMSRAVSDTAVVAVRVNGERRVVVAVWRRGPAVKVRCRRNLHSIIAVTTTAATGHATPSETITSTRTITITSTSAPVTNATVIAVSRVAPTVIVAPSTTIIHRLQALILTSISIVRPMGRPVQTVTTRPDVGHDNSSTMVIDVMDTRVAEVAPKEAVDRSANRCASVSEVAGRSGGVWMPRAGRARNPARTMRQAKGETDAEEAPQAGKVPVSSASHTVGRRTSKVAGHRC